MIFGLSKTNGEIKTKLKHEKIKILVNNYENRTV